MGTIGYACSHQKETARLISQSSRYLCRQLPTLPHSSPCSTVGPAGLNFRVRDGNGWNPRGKITDFVSQLPQRHPWPSRTSSFWMMYAKSFIKDRHPLGELM